MTDLSLKSVKAFLEDYSPKLEDQDVVNEIETRVNAISRRIRDLKKQDDERRKQRRIAREMQEKIDEGSIDLSKLSPRDRALFPSLRIHPKSGLCERFSIGWPAHIIK